MAGPRVGVVDAGIGTWRAFLTILDYLGVNAEVARSAELIENYSHIILPGVGNFTLGARRLEEGGLDRLINEIRGIRKTLSGGMSWYATLGIEELRRSRLWARPY